ncbi:VOC family protein [Mycolicibacterium moriokaense]|uniref:Glyoxalase/bleomycin resistance protein/dioxygenase superfamily protein n=1 Tax=Mycolicibacterium moriokaense TaxID=39691 RepID=A0A318H914_9MYCO|nr:VOC family protein [Mycolicibacterium moriokaense]PXX01650.1 glyoxalase/bleomycin resistance protein/dioxygenase superfamily protein [Mycolicibacterium moriokaense]
MEIGDLFHVVHVVDDLPGAEAWYDAVFCPTYMFRRHESDLDHRTASLMLVADYPAEPMTPHADPAGTTGTIGKFRRRFGQRLHSLAWYCDSVAEGFERFRSFGLRVAGDGGAVLNEPPTRGGIYTHPRDTFGLIELMEPRVGGRGGAPVGDSLGKCYDPRLTGDHDASWWTHSHPLGIRRTSHITVLVDDLDRAVRLYETTLDGNTFHQSSSPLAAFVAVGPSSVVELRCPQPGTPQAHALTSEGAMIWSTTFLVDDLDAASQHLADVGVAAQRGEGEVAVAPDQAYGARYSFTATVTRGDPRC